MNNMHLKIIVLAIDSVLRGCMKVELEHLKTLRLILKETVVLCYTSIKIYLHS